jgi:hypothetical protein
MIDEMKDKLKALAGLAGNEEEVQEKPQDLISQLKAKKDARRDDIESRIESGEYQQEAMDDKDAFEEASSGLSQEEKERVAAETVARKRRAAGIMNPEEDKEAKKIMLNREINK